VGTYRCTCNSLHTLNNNGHTCDSIASYSTGMGILGGGFIILVIVLVLVGIFIYRHKKKKGSNDEIMDNLTSPPL